MRLRKRSVRSHVHLHRVTGPSGPAARLQRQVQERSQQLLDPLGRSLDSVAKILVQTQDANMADQQRRTGVILWT